MKERMLGGKLPVSAVAMGCMRLSDAKETPDRVIGTALESGINCFDHADIYGGGRCEELFGDWLAEHPAVRDRIVTASLSASIGKRPSSRYSVLPKSSRKVIMSSVTMKGLSEIASVFGSNPLPVSKTTSSRSSDSSNPSAAVIS